MGELGQTPQREEPGRTPDGQTLIAPARDLALRAPLGWLAAGWRDYWARQQQPGKISHDGSSR